MSKREQLLEITGVGESTADKIEAIYADVEPTDTQAEVVECIDYAYDYVEAGYPQYATKYVRRAYEELQE
jgi:hypothetical protein